MNASEARAVTNGSGAERKLRRIQAFNEKVADLAFCHTVGIDNEIKEKANSGCGIAYYEVKISDSELELPVANAITDHYQADGFKVSYWQGLHSMHFQIEW